MTVKLHPKMFRWYPNLAADWSGPLTVIGEYSHSQAHYDEVVVKNANGQTMAVRAQHIEAN